MDRKRSSVVSPDKSNKKFKEVSSDDEDDIGITAETILGFPKHPTKSNGEIMKEDYKFVLWAKHKKEKGEAYGRLEDFVEWVESEEGQEIWAEVLRLKAEEDRVTADTILGIKNHENTSNGELMKKHYSYIGWARNKKENEALFGKLVKLVDWADSAEGHRVESQVVFNMGKHKGETFEQIARTDPRYHITYSYALEMNNKSPPPLLTGYISWFDRRGAVAAAASTHASSSVGTTLTTEDIETYDDIEAGPTLSTEEIIRKRVQEAEARGEVIEIE